MSPSIDKSALEEALRDHHRLLEVQTRLGRLLAQESCPAFKGWIAEVRDELAVLSDLLDGHFAREEDDRLHDEIRAVLPNSSYRLEALLQEHAEILALARHLRDLALRVEMPPQELPLRRDASDFFAALDAHERSERELFLLALEGEGPGED